MFEVILIAIDEDSHATEAVRLGGRLAEQLGSRVILYHVVPQPPTYAMQAGFYLPPFEMRKAATEHGKQFLEQAAADLPAAVPSRNLVKYAEYSPWREIVQLAERERAELIVLGAHSQGALKRPSLGSTAEKVSRHVRVPILLVR